MLSFVPSIRSPWSPAAAAALCLLAGCDRPGVDGPGAGTDPVPLAVAADGTALVDSAGRQLLLHGINVGGGSKLPSVPDVRSHEATFLDTSELSFVGRPFPLAEAPAHFARIRDWGFNFIRLLVSWEGIAHAGPDTVDRAYVDYVQGLVAAAADQDLRVLVDMHQDVWSRFTGGDGAPAWTLDRVGFDRSRIAETGAALLHAEAGPHYRHLIWPTNHMKLAAATMFTLFFGGDAFAPSLQIEGQSAQSYLQEQYIGAFASLARALAASEAVIGYDLMNEPGTGFLGLDSLRAWESQLELGPMPTPFQSMAAARFPQTVTVYEFTGLGFAPAGTETINPASAPVWQAGAPDPWQRAGVWGVQDGRPRLLRPDHFAGTDTGPVDVVAGFVQPFYRALAAAIHAADPDALVFLEPPAEANAAIDWPDGEGAGAGAVFAPHWYDALTLISGEFDPSFTVRREPAVELVSGDDAVRALFAEQIGRLLERGTAAGLPTVIGEFGVPFDPAAHGGGYGSQTEALAAYYAALDANLVGSALWTYNPDNTHADGDGWNLEDFSVIGEDDPGGRAVAGFLRPRAMAIAGRIEALSYDVDGRSFRLRYTADPGVEAPSEIRVPAGIYGQAGPTVRIEGGESCPARRAGWLCVQAEAEVVTVAVDP